MKRYLILVLAALALAIAAPSAFATRVVFDPNPQPPSSNPNNYFNCTPGHDTPCNVFYPGYTYTTRFQQCGVTGVTLPSGFNSDNWCLWFLNVTQAGLVKFTFTFNVPNDPTSNDNSTSLDCKGQPSGITPNCPTGELTSGQSLTLSFTANPAIRNGNAFWMITDFVNQPGTASVRVSVPEPGELGLFGLGLLLLGAGVAWQRRRHTSRGNVAA